jgi:hypothetical protein
MAKVLGLVSDAVLMDQSFDVTIYIYAGIALEKPRLNLASRSMSNEVEMTWTL